MYVLAKKNHLGPTVSGVIHTKHYLLVKVNQLGPTVITTCTTYATSVTPYTWKNHLGPMVSGAIHTTHVRSGYYETLGSDG